LTPVASAALVAQTVGGQLPPLRTPADLAAHVLIEEDDPRTPNSYRLSWRRWLAERKLQPLEPRRWLYLQFTHQQIQGALAGQGVALARISLVHDQLARGELVELFDGHCRIASPGAFHLIVLPHAAARPEVLACADWIRREARRTRAALGEGAASA
jgi:LysR family glycine cleavage system transcriptional activator